MVFGLYFSGGLLLLFKQCEAVRFVSCMHDVGDIVSLQCPLVLGGFGFF